MKSLGECHVTTKYLNETDSMRWFAFGCNELVDGWVS